MFSKLAALILPRGSEVFPDPWTLFMKFNGLSGQYGNPNIQRLNDGSRQLTIGVSTELATKIMALRGKAKLGIYKIKAYCLKSE